MRSAPAGILEAIRDLLPQHADELGLDPATVTAHASRAVTARQRDGGLLRLDVCAYDRSELSR